MGIDGVDDGEAFQDKCGASWMAVFSFAWWKGQKGALKEMKYLRNTFGRKPRMIYGAVVIYSCEYTYSRERIMKLKYPNLLLKGVS